MVHFDPSKKFSRTGISKLRKSETLTRLMEFTWPLPEALCGAKPSHPDYVLTFCSANVPGITYKLILGIFVLHLKMRVPPRLSTAIDFHR
jgi:hypothetical protein